MACDSWSRNYWFLSNPPPWLSPIFDSLASLTQYFVSRLRHQGGKERERFQGRTESGSGSPMFILSQMYRMQLLQGKLLSLPVYSYLCWQATEWICYPRRLCFSPKGSPEVSFLFSFLFFSFSFSFFFSSLFFFFQKTLSTTTTTTTTTTKDLLSPSPTLSHQQKQPPSSVRESPPTLP